MLDRFMGEGLTLDIFNIGLGIMTGVIICLLGKGLYRDLADSHRVYRLMLKYSHHQRISLSSTGVKIMDREHEVSSKELRDEAQELYVTEHGLIDAKELLHKTS